MIKKLLLSLHGDLLYRNSFYLMLATAVMAGFGFFFWLITARLFATTNIGVATTLISVMNLVSLLSPLGFGAAFVRFLPTAENKNERINTGLILVSASSAILALLFIVFARVISPQLVFVQHNLFYSTIFIVACVMNTLNLLTNSVFLAYRQTKYILVINVIFSFFKMLAPLAFVAWGAFGIFTAAAAAQLLGTLLSLFAMAKWFDYRPAFTINRQFIATIWRYNLTSYVSGAINLLPVTLLPIIILNNLGAEPAAYYYIAMMIGNLLYAIPFATTSALFAEGSHDEKSLGHNFKKSLVMISLLLLPSIVVLFLGSGEILHIFGKAYEGGGATFLQLVALAGITVSGFSLCGSLFLVKKDNAATIILNTVYTAATVGFAYALLPFGLPGIGIAWILGNGAATVAGCILYFWRPHKYIRLKYENATHEKRSVMRSKIAFMQARRKNGSRNNILLCYPDRPYICHTLYHVAHKLGLTISNDPSVAFDVGVIFCDITKIPDDPVRTKLTEQHAMVNGRCIDISKSRVEEVFKNVFGYGSHIDPRTYDGTYIRKSERNTAHDGKIMDGPSEPEEGYIYQRLINNVHDNDTVYEIRTMIAKDTIPFTLYKFKSINDRFNNTLYPIWVDTDEALNPDEQAKVLAFCREFGLDYGELDILRDKDDGKIYIIDANNTPGKPQRGVDMSKEMHDRLVSVLADAFETKFIKKA